MDTRNNKYAKLELTDNQLVEFIQNYYKEHNNVPTNKNWKLSNGFPCSPCTIVKHFGSWNDFLHKAELPIKRIVNRNNLDLDGRLCTGCQQMLPITEFSRNKYPGKCANCVRLFHRTKYKKLSPNQKANRNNFALRKQERNVYKDKPCMDCKQRFPAYVMHFDHRPDEIKLYEPSKSMMMSKAKFLAEIAKCDLVCANCHAQRTYIRRQELRSKNLGDGKI